MDTETLLAFVREHKDEDPLKLLLQQKKYPGVDMEQVAQQIEGQRQASVKWPTLAGCRYFLYPPRLNREQSSSEATAKHKVEIVQEFAGKHKTKLRIADLTGGMGIDSIAFAKMDNTEVDYVERDPELCRIMEHNVSALGLKNVNIHSGDSIEWLRNRKKKYDVIFIDPARRDTHGKKVAAFEDCKPNILEHKELLMSYCDWMMIKASPMMDIDKGVEQLGNVGDVYIVAVKNECKELIFTCNSNNDKPLIHCNHIIDNYGTCLKMDFTRSDEAQAEASFCTKIGQYIYEPDAATMKGGPYKLLCSKWGLKKLSRNTHLYTSDNLIDWTGRVFAVLNETQLNKKAIAAAIPEGKAHVVVRNYPVEAAPLQKQLGLKEGGDLFVIATTIGTRKTGFICHLEKRR